LTAGAAIANTQTALKLSANLQKLLISFPPCRRLLAGTLFDVGLKFCSYRLFLTASFVTSFAVSQHPKSDFGFILSGKNRFILGCLKYLKFVLINIRN